MINKKQKKRHNGGFNMEYLNNSTEKRTNKHLNMEERIFIKLALSLGIKISHIAKNLGRSRTTIHSEIKRGWCEQIVQGYKKIWIYLPEKGTIVYSQNRQNSINKSKLTKASQFIMWVEDNVKKYKLSFDALVGRAIREGLFKPEEMVCTKTLYNYQEKGYLTLKAHDLPLKIRYSKRKSVVRKNKRIMGKSIDMRDKNINNRHEFGHWEIDTVRGSKLKGEPVLITILERNSRYFAILKCNSAKSIDVLDTLKNWIKSMSANTDIGAVFKSITSDNGTEFTLLSELEKDGIDVYYTHPYSSWERGSNERHNGLLRRHLPKGVKISSVNEDTIKIIENWCNNLPRKILSYATPLEIFKEEYAKLCV